MEKYYPTAGQLIDNAIDEAISMAAEISTNVNFTFNGAKIEVAKDSDPKLIYRDAMRAIGGLIKAVEPYPIPNLSIEEIENDNRILNENRKRLFDQEREAYIKRKEGQESHCPKI